MLVISKKHTGCESSPGEKVFLNSLTWSSVLMTIALSYIYFVKPMSNRETLGHLEPLPPRLFIIFEIVLPSIGFGLLAGIGAYLVHRSRRELRANEVTE